MRASGATERMRRRMIGVMMRLGTGRVWSEEMRTMSFLPLASSSRLGEPMGLSRERSTVSASPRGLRKSSAPDWMSPAKFFSGMLASIVRRS